MAGRPFNPALLADLDGLANRGYTDGFYQRHHSHETQNYLDGHSKSKQAQYVGDVKSVVDGWAEVEVKNKFAVGDSLEIIHPSGNRIVQLSEMTRLDGSAMDVAPGVGHTVRLPLADGLQGAMISRLH